MKVKIIEVKKRSLLARIVSINHWRVTYSVDGRIYKANLWAGVDEPKVDSLIWSLQKDVRNRVIKFNYDNAVRELKGKLVDIDKVY